MKNKSTVNDRVLVALTQKGNWSTAKEVFNYMIEHNIKVDNSRTPDKSVSSALSTMHKEGKVLCHKEGKEAGQYGLPNWEKANDSLFNTPPATPTDNTKFQNQSESVALKFKEDKAEKKGHAKSFLERDLHPILATYLAKKGKDVYTKTIFHEKSNSKDKNQTWTHPDLVSLYLKYPEDKSCRSLLKTINHSESVILSSYEMKKEVNSDNELKQYYFQAVSNSSWANYGWLVAYKFNDELYDEIERLNQTFGIGVIQLGNSIESCKVLFPARHNELDFRTIDKLCRINSDFKSFIENVERLINADSNYLGATSSEFKNKCDEVKTDKQLEEYCQEHNIV